MRCNEAQGRDIPSRFVWKRQTTTTNTTNTNTNTTAAAAAADDPIPRPSSNHIKQATDLFNDIIPRNQSAFRLSYTW